MVLAVLIIIPKGTVSKTDVVSIGDARTCKKCVGRYPFKEARAQKIGFKITYLKV